MGICSIRILFIKQFNKQILFIKQRRISAGPGSLLSKLLNKQICLLICLINRILIEQRPNLFINLLNKDHVY